VRLVSAPDRTVAALRNLGASIARGDILAYVDADCIVAPDWLTVALPHFDDSRVGAVGSPTRIPADAATWVQRAWAVHRHRRNRRRTVAWLPTENLLIRKSALLAIGGFNEKLVTCEDIDVCYRLRARYSIVNEPCLRAVHLGEAPTLASFFAKEVWRGRDNLRGALAHRLEAAELPSLALPFYYQVGLAALALGLGHACLTRRKP